jgi:uncharacterized membrane protein SpoIIM required for sporulation
VNLVEFVAANRGDWERLETLITALGGSRGGSLTPSEVREFGLLHRKVSADLARARAENPGSKVVEYLNELALRSHNAIYRTPRQGARRALEGLARGIPAAVRRHMGAFGMSLLLFGSGALLGALATALDESIAEAVLGAGFVENIRNGEYWIHNVFDVVPHAVASTGILTNNISVAITVFALGITGILGPVVLFQNGVMLGAVCTLCAQYGLLGRFVPFVFPHGVIEISAILLAGAGGLVLFDGWLAPGDRTRAQGLRAGAREGLMVASSALPVLLLAGFVEGMISPVEELSGALRIALGLTLGVALWSWLLLTPEKQ